MPAPRGRPEFVPTEIHRRTVRAMAAYGVPQKSIASVIGICANTLRLHFAEEIDRAATEANAKIAETLFRVATEGTGRDSVLACMFWLKCRAGWREARPDDHAPSLAPPVIEAEVAEDGWGSLLN